MSRSNRAPSKTAHRPTGARRNERMSTTRRLLVQPQLSTAIEQGIADIKREQALPLAFPDDVEALAEQVAKAPRLPELDRTDIAFVTIDPAGSMDLDQALAV